MKLTFDISDETEKALSRSNAENNLNTGKELTVEEFAALEARDGYRVRHVEVWKARDFVAIEARLEQKKKAASGKLDEADIQALEAIYDAAAAKIAAAEAVK